MKKKDNKISNNDIKRHQQLTAAQNHTLAISPLDYTVTTSTSGYVTTGDATRQYTRDSDTWSQSAAYNNIHQIDLTESMEILAKILVEITKDIKKDNKNRCGKTVAKTLQKITASRITNLLSGFTAETKMALTPGDEKVFYNSYKKMVRTLMITIMTDFLTVTESQDKCVLRKLQLLGDEKDEN